MKRVIGCLLVAAVACLSMGLAAAATVDAGLLVGHMPDLASGAMMASAVLGAPLADAALPVTMRAKLQVGFIQAHEDRRDANGHYDPNGTAVKTLETLQMHAVCAPKYDESGLDEDNTFAKFSPGAQLSINIANPALWGHFKVGDRFYVDFTKTPT